ncbi:hypothetical protein CR161_00280 [Prosthecochloris sp. ZM]|uniref:hypothetical protein n=1 Tax=Prosthecochloris sp. ZM TaxID=2283143 RepID=UPI000DF74296|nr:hypothetical protein [Prosthecochloris sp. ZM]RDD29264.1 hypothetical protein CR161_00280 [Prosthecochloris sp. ZM]
MPTGTIKPQVFRDSLLSPSVRKQETQDASLADVIRLVAESVADAQTALDRASANLVTELAGQQVEVIPSITETIDSDGNVKYSQAKPRKVSLLDIGVMPTFYQFSQTVIEIQMDLKISEELNEKGIKSGRMALLADTAGIRFERKLNRDVTVSSKVTATLVPVPMPLRLEPVRTTDAD